MDMDSGLRRLSPHNSSNQRKWGGKRESNPQPPEPQSGALPVELFPPQELHYSNLAGRSRLSCTDRLDAAYAYVLES
jgi:hypothetical protein